MTDDYLTREEAAVYAGVSLITIDRRLRDGILPRHATDVPRRVLIPRTALDLLLKRRISGPTRASTQRRRHERSTDQSHETTDP
jgi:excisionase family DNA binding protein